MEFFISDTHFDHDNIIRFAERPFRNVKQMNEYMIEAWNAKVNKGDVVYHLGDIGFFRSPQAMQETVKKLNGRKILIKGNHDRYTNSQYAAAGIEEIHHELTLTREGADWTLIHKPSIMEPYLGYVLCGHIHQQFVYQGNNLNMSVEVWGYQPVTLWEISKRIIWLRSNVFDTNTQMKLFGKHSKFNEPIRALLPEEMD